MFYIELIYKREILREKFSLFVLWGLILKSFLESNKENVGDSA